MRIGAYWLFYVSVEKVVFSGHPKLFIIMASSFHSYMCQLSRTIVSFPFWGIIILSDL